VNTFGDRIAEEPSKFSAPFDAGEYWENRLKAHPGLCGVGNTSLGSSYVGWLYKMRRSIFMRLVHSLDFDYRASSVLDIGSGTGFYLKLWNELGAGTVSGCDLTDTAVSRLQRDFPGVRIDRLDIVVAVKQDARPVVRRSRAIALADDDRMAGGRPHHGLEAQAGKILRDKVGGRLAEFLIRAVGRDRRDAHELEQSLDALVDIGIDAVEDRLKLRRVGHFSIFPWLAGVVLHFGF